MDTLKPMGPSGFQSPTLDPGPLVAIIVAAVGIFCVCAAFVVRYIRLRTKRTKEIKATNNPDLENQIQAANHTEKRTSQESVSTTETDLKGPVYVEQHIPKSPVRVEPQAEEMKTPQRISITVVYDTKHEPQAEEKLPEMVAAQVKTHETLKEERPPFLLRVYSPSVH